MRVLHLLKSNAYSGAENIAITICKEIKGMGIESVYVSPEGSIRERVEKEEVRYYGMKHFCMGEFSSVCRSFRPHIIHAHDFAASIMAASVNPKATVISHLHNDPPWIRKWTLKSIAYKSCSKKYTRILLVSEAVFDEAVFLTDKQRVSVMGNPIDRHYIEQRAKEWQAEPTDVLFVGRFMKQKNPLCFVRLAERLYRKYPDIRVRMIGGGEMLEQCRQYIMELKMGDIIKLTGFLENPYPYMKNARLLIVTSDWEGYGLVACEALTLSVPVLARRVGGLPEAVGQIDDALYMDEDEAYEKAESLLFDKAAREQYQRKIKDKTMQSRDQYIKKLLQIYKEAV